MAKIHKTAQNPIFAKKEYICYCNILEKQTKKTFVYVHGKFIVYMNIGNKIISKLDRNIHDLSKPCTTLYF